MFICLWSSKFVEFLFTKHHVSLATITQCLSRFTSSFVYEIGSLTHSNYLYTFISSRLGRLFCCFVHSSSFVCSPSMFPLSFIFWSFLTILRFSSSVANAIACIALSYYVQCEHFSSFDLNFVFVFIECLRVRSSVVALGFFFCFVSIARLRSFKSEWTLNGSGHIQLASQCQCLFVEGMDCLLY